MMYEAVPLIPRSVLFADRRYARPRISPDGSKLAYLAPHGGLPNVHVGPLADPASARPLTSGRGIGRYGFCHDDQTLFYLRDTDGDENWRLWLVDLASGEQRCATPFDQVSVRVLGHDRSRPTEMLLGINKDNPQWHDVYRLNLTDGSLTKEQHNPGYARWLVDTDLAVRGAVAVTEAGGHQIFLRDGPSGDLTRWLAVPPEDAMSVGISFSRDGQTIYLISSLDANAIRLVAIDVASGERTVLAEDPAFDISHIEWDCRTERPQAVVFNKEREEWVFLDPVFATEFGWLRKRLGADCEIGLSRTARDDGIWLVSALPCDGPVSYYSYQRSTAQLTFLFHSRPELNEYQLARMEPFEYTARDGLRVPGYVSYPPNVPARDLPAVVHVHGGPWERHEWGYDIEAQWLANRGYACVQVNFRGSTGYGKAFVNAGDKEWGRAMHTDLLDAIGHLAAWGIIDPSRVGIMGGSFGGYAALVGAAFTPEVFRCAIDLCGPANLLTFLPAMVPYRRPITRLIYTRVGDPNTEEEMLRQRSPLSAADRIRIPVLVAHGENDVFVRQHEAEQIVAALRHNGVPHEYLLFPHEGHGLDVPENRLRYYAAAERLLAEQLGGRLEP
ncbi:S9 family peptidase [Rhizocola hellebori]|nr:S9 family peptidase [Rhizocola hellebori]